MPTVTVLVKITHELREDIKELTKILKIKNTGFIAFALERLFNQEEIELPKSFFSKIKKTGYGEYINRDVLFRIYIEKEYREKVEKIAELTGLKPIIVYWYALHNYAEYLKKEYKI